MHSISGSSIAGKYERLLVGDLESGAAEQIDGGVLQAAFRNAEFQFHD